MRLVASSSSLPMTSLASRFAASSASAVASTSRVQLRSFQTTSSSAEEGQRSGRPNPSSSPSTAQLGEIADTVRRNATPGGTTGVGFQRAGRGAGASGNVFTPGAGLKPEQTFGQRERPEPRPEHGQHLVPHSVSYEAFNREQTYRVPPRLGPRRRIAETLDQIHKLGLNPGKPSLHDDSYKNGAFLSPYVSEMGKILSRNKTNLTWKSQKSVGKAIRRARSMGIIPVLAKTDAWKSNAGSYWDYSKRSRGGS